MFWPADFLKDPGSCVRSIYMSSSVDPGQESDSTLHTRASLLTRVREGQDSAELE